MSKSRAAKLLQDIEQRKIDQHTTALVAYNDLIRRSYNEEEIDPDEAEQIVDAAGKNGRDPKTGKTYFEADLDRIEARTALQEKLAKGDELKAERAALTSEIATREAEHNSVVTAFDRFIGPARERLDTLMKYINQLQVYEAELIDRCSPELKKKWRSIGDQRRDLFRSRYDQQQELVKAENRLRTARSNDQGKLTQLAMQEGKASEAAKQLASLQRQVSSAEAEVATIRGRLDRITATLDALDEESATVKREMILS